MKYKKLLLMAVYFVAGLVFSKNVTAFDRAGVSSHTSLSNQKGGINRMPGK